MKKFNVGFLCLVIALGTLLLSGCGSTVDANGPGQGKKISVYTSFYAMYDFAQKIGGDKIQLTNLIPAGTEPHEWEPSPRDMVNIEKADVLIYNGAGMENWIDQVSGAIQNKQLIILDTSKDLQLLDNPDHHEDLQYDPHVWLNPMLAKKQMEAIKNALVTTNPANKDYYEKNYTDNAKKLDVLDKEYQDAVAQFKNKDIVVAHQAFSYLCEAYGLKQVSIEGLAADSEPTPSRMAEIVNFAKAQDLKYIFFEELVSPKVAEAIATEVGAKTGVLNPLEGLEEKDMKAGKDYFSVMRDNLAVLKKALE
ncbi:MAG: metal ABC transporter substrate-binding protein [Bacillota bacterium]